MRLYHHTLRYGDHLPSPVLVDSGLHLLHAHGRGIQVDVPAGWTTLCWAPAGQVALAIPGSEWQLDGRRMQLWTDGPLRIRSSGAQGWSAMLGSSHAWSAMSGRRRSDAATLLPWRGRPGREVAGLVCRLLRNGRQPASRRAGDCDALLTALVDALVERQQDLQSLLARCSGRSLARQQQTLLRLLRVRHAIECNTDLRLDLEQLAAAARYSPCHLIRLHRAVFGETPSEYATRLRERQAWDMVCGSRLLICEITEMLGFESQSAFCRAFKNAFGRTTSQVRGSRARDGVRPRVAA